MPPHRPTIFATFSGRCLRLLFCLAALAQAQASTTVFEFTSRTLEGNPLNDPVKRKVVIFSPAQAATNALLPVMYYLPGFGGSSEGFIQDRARWERVIQKLADDVQPLRWVVVDGRTRWYCSQYIDSPAQGNYATYICNEIVSEVQQREPLPGSGVRRIIAGHSSGGFGALRLGMLRPDIFDAVIALSPDSDFPVSHLPLVRLPGVTNISLAQVQALQTAERPNPMPTDGDLVYALALSAAYAPRGVAYPGQFEWLYDRTGAFRPEVWQKWLENDPLTIVRDHPDAFRPEQAIYLDGARQDEYKANIGARKIYDVLRARKARCTFVEPPGKHGDRLPDRLEDGLRWLFRAPSAH